MAGEKLTKADLVDILTNKIGVDRKDVQGYLDIFLETISAALKSGASVELRGFGTFGVKIRKGTENARNPKTGERFTVSDHGVVYFKPGRELRDACKKSGTGKEHP